MTHPRQLLHGLLAILWLIFASPHTLLAQGREPVVIVNPSVPVASLSRNQLRSIFAMRLKVWPDGQAIRVFVFPPDSLIHRRFTIALLHIYPYQLQRVWDRLLFSGLGQAPQRVRSRMEMELKVATVPGAIGYLDHPPARPDVRILEVRP